MMLKKWITRFNYTNLMFTQCLLSHCHYKSLFKTLRLLALKSTCYQMIQF